MNNINHLCEGRNNMESLKVLLESNMSMLLRREAEEKKCSVAEIIRRKIELGHKIDSFNNVVGGMRSDFEKINQHLLKEDEKNKSDQIWIRYTLFLIFNCITHIIKSSFEDQREYSQFVVEMKNRLEDFKKTNKVSF